jgi:uncharacterized membrane protein YcjF (UPF0283 family)
VSIYIYKEYIGQRQTKDEKSEEKILIEGEQEKAAAAKRRRWSLFLLLFLILFCFCFLLFSQQSGYSCDRTIREFGAQL